MRPALRRNPASLGFGCAMAAAWLFAAALGEAHVQAQLVGGRHTPAQQPDQVAEDAGGRGPLLLWVGAERLVLPQRSDDDVADDYFAGGAEDSDDDLHDSDDDLHAQIMALG